MTLNKMKWEDLTPEERDAFRRMEEMQPEPGNEPLPLTDAPEPESSQPEQSQPEQAQSAIPLQDAAQVESQPLMDILTEMRDFLKDMHDRIVGGSG